MLKTLLKQLIIEQCINNFFNSIQQNFLNQSKFLFQTDHLVNTIAFKVSYFNNASNKYTTHYIACANSAWDTSVINNIQQQAKEKFIFLHKCNMNISIETTDTIIRDIINLRENLI